MTLLHACQYYLCQAQQLLDRIEAAQYAMPHAHCFGSSIGGHVRHCLDHYVQFLRGLKKGEVNYDSRERNQAVEADIEVARGEIASLLSALDRLEGSLNDEREVMVRLDCGGERPHWKRSSLGRELQFLASHTVHHFAIIAIMCRSMEVALEPGFGLAPSTIKHQESA